MIQQVTIIFWSLLFICPGLCCAGLVAEELLLIVNRNVQDGAILAEHYRELRGVPVTNQLEVDLPREESCSRREYDDRLLSPLKKLLSKPEFRKIRCLVLFYGIPLSIRAEVGQQELSHSVRLQVETSAAVDSELVLALADSYPLAGWSPNPLFAPQGKGRKVAGVLLVSRLDAAQPDIVKRIMADSIVAENEGLRGRAYFDARWPANLPEQNVYQQFDATLHAAASLTREISQLPVVLDTGEALLAQAPEAAIYCGWYRLADYQDVFSWRLGAVGYHVASGECTSLKNPENHGWCKGILEGGGAATLGPVAEPYLAAFPRPDLFFAYLLNGYYTLVESYFFSLPYVSWQMILVGDPLYRPFRYL